MSESLTKEEFIERFVNRMVSRAGTTFDDGEPIEDYARQAAPSYFENEYQREDGPEECADSDMSYWGES
jgi:hypothetical protein